MKKRFQNQVIIITGASSGIGAATARLFAKEGAKTVLVSRNRLKLQKVASEINSFGLEPLIIPTDISDQKQVAIMVSQVLDEHGRIDVLFNNAGASFVGEVAQHDFTENLKKMIDVDFLGTVHVTKAVLPILKKQNNGHIINMSSVVGKKAFPKFTGYSSVMHAISGFTDGLRQELSDTPIGVSIIHPALTQTALLEKVNPADMPAPFRAMTPMLPEQVAQAVVDGVFYKRPKIIVPFQPKLLLLLDTLSTKLADGFIRLISRPRIARYLGMYKGKLYHDKVEYRKAA